MTSRRGTVAKAPIYSALAEMVPLVRLVTLVLAAAAISPVVSRPPALGVVLQVLALTVPRQVK